MRWYPLIRKAMAMNTDIDLKSTAEIERTGAVANMNLIGANASALMQVAIEDTPMGAWLRLDVRDRQLAVLRNTFPPWRITYGLTPTGLGWRAEPSWRLTLEEVTVGVRRLLECRSPIDLMAELTDQVAIIQRLARPAREAPVPPG
ncbi:hypothetical protein [Nonomuraea sp. 10N515B]|uniref:hypothetical protein n=1 Tax=Nonomuraea sp. 10N515B TaxID=3457422 RepID=UPI003FCC9CA9